MASSSGNSSSGALMNSGSENDQVRVLMDQKKRKRMLSNRESARRSRMRKQKKMEELVAEGLRLEKENGQILTTIGLTAQQLMRVEAENSVLTAQMVELNQRLNSLQDILTFLTLTGNNYGVEMDHGVYSGAVDPFLHGMVGVMNQPIMAASAADVFQDW